ncbi:mRNA 3'-end-processing protein rna14 [Coemansia sp. Benny D115]|nr:mRNA 3'-end-processing protein rna14 [Coemansia sp. Benny D115]
MSAVDTSVAQHPPSAHYLSKESTGNAEVDMWRQRLTSSPYDGNAWHGLLRAVKASNDDKLIEETFEDALKQYPSAGSLLADFAEFELNRGNQEKAETMFNSCLFNVPSIDLWQCYLDYVLKINMDDQGLVTQPERRSTVMECYKLVLEHVGSDRDAGKIWSSYIEFISSAKSHAPYEEQQKNDLLRETYQAAVSLPLLGIEKLWKGFDAFENKQDRVMAKQLLSKHSPTYMAARTALREMNRLWEAIKRAQPPHGLPVPPSWTPREVDYLVAWKNYLKWEMSDPLRLGDAAALNRRVLYAYSQACMALRFYPEVWIEYADHLLSCDQANEALAKLQTASQVLPDSLSVQFAYAEMAERMKQPDVCKQVYEYVVSTKRADIEATMQRYSQRVEKLEKKLRALTAKRSSDEDQDDMQGVMEGEDIDGDDDDDDMSVLSQESGNENGGSDYNDEAADGASMASGSPAPRGPSFGSGPSESELLTHAERAQKAVRKRLNGTKEHIKRRLEEKKEIYTISWIMYLRYTQRSEGIDAVRQLLRRPRSDPTGYITYHLYIAAALMEYHVARRPGIAGKLFEFYSKVYSENPEYIVEYMNFLINSGDDANARSLFERFQGTGVGDSTHLWSMLSDFEYNYGDMGAISKMDKRFIERFDHENTLTRMAARYGYMNVQSVAVNEFGFPYRGDIGGDFPVESGAGRRAVAFPEDPAGFVGQSAEYGKGTVLGGTPNASEFESVGEQLGVTVGSVTGRHLHKNQLLMPLQSGRFVRPVVSALEEYAPVIEPFVPAEPMQYNISPVSAVSGRMDSHASASLASNPRPFGHLLDQGDVLSFVAASVAAPDTSRLDSIPLDLDALLGAVMQQKDMIPRMQSKYRPLAYMPWLTRSDYGQKPPYQGPHGGYSRSDYPASHSYNPRSTSRGRSGGDADGYRGGSSGGSRGYSRSGHSYRHAPYARSDSQSSQRGGGGSNQYSPSQYGPGQHNPSQYGSGQYGSRPNDRSNSRTYY